MDNLNIIQIDSPHSLHRQIDLGLHSLDRQSRYYTDICSHKDIYSDRHGQSRQIAQTDSDIQTQIVQIDTQAYIYIVYRQPRQIDQIDSQKQIAQAQITDIDRQTYSLNGQIDIDSLDTDKLTDIGQGSATCGSRAACGSFDDKMRLSSSML